MMGNREVWVGWGKVQQCSSQHLLHSLQSFLPLWALRHDSVLRFKKSHPSVVFCMIPLTRVLHDAIRSEHVT